MGNLPTATDIEAAAKGAGLSMREVCRRAKIAPSTFSRWKAGDTSPRLNVIEQMQRAIANDWPAASAP